MLASVEKQSYWQRLAFVYDTLGSPLKPGEEDIRNCESAIDTWAAAHPVAHPRALLLGVTPGIALLRWPAGTTLIGTDNSFPMVSSVWPGNDAGTRFGICASWLRLPLPLSSVHIAIGDGSLNCVRHPEDASAACRSVRGALHEDGLFLLRCYVRPDKPESPEQVFDDMFRGAIRTLAQFKFRLFLAMPQKLRSGVAVDDFYRVWASHSIDPVRLAGFTGWPLREIQTIEGYRGASTVHTFPTLAEFRCLLREYFDEAALITPSYALGERCPLFVLRPRPGVCR